MYTTCQLTNTHGQLKVYFGLVSGLLQYISRPETSENFPKQKTFLSKEIKSDYSPYINIMEVADGFVNKSENWGLD